jgi:hypothetical protein
VPPSLHVFFVYTTMSTSPFSLLWTVLLLIVCDGPEGIAAQNKPFTAFAQSFPATFNRAPPPSPPRFGPPAAAPSAPTFSSPAAPAASVSAGRSGCALILPETGPSGQQACISFEVRNLYSA